MKNIIKKIDVFGIGVLIYLLINTLNRLVLCPFIVLKAKNFSTSLLFVLLISMTLYYICVKVYDFLKRDYLKIEAYKKAKQYKIGVIESFINKVTKKLPPKVKYAIKLLVFITVGGPFITVLYYRKGSFLYNGIIESEVRFMFIASSILFSVYWTSVLLGLFSLKEFFLTVFQ